MLPLFRKHSPDGAAWVRVR